MEVGAEHYGKRCMHFVKIQFSLALGGGHHMKQSWEAVRAFCENSMSLDSWECDEFLI